MTNTKLDSDCTPRCRSTKCAANLISVITRGTTHQIKCYFNTCQNASHVSDRFGRNALHMAASCGKFEIVDWLLLEKHASLSAEDLESGWTALHRSIFHGQVIAAVYLIHVSTKQKGEIPLILYILTYYTHISGTMEQHNVI